MTLLLVLIGAFWLRMLGTEYGLPVVTNTDELPIAMGAARMLGTGDLNPHFFNYPSLFIYLEAACYWLLFKLGQFSGHYQQLTDIQRPELLHAGRILTVLMTTATVWVTYLATCRLTRSLPGAGEQAGRWCGIAAAAIVATAFLHVSNSYVIGVDGPMGLFVALALWVALRRLNGGNQWRHYLLGALFVGLATGTKYTGFISAVPLLAAHFWARDDARVWREKLLDGRLIAFALLAALVFFLSTPYALLDFARFWQALVTEGRHYAGGHAGAEAVGASYGAYLKMLPQQVGLSSVLLAGVGLFALLLRAPRQGAVLLLFPLVYLLFIGRYPVYFSRNLVAIVPFIAVAAGAGLWTLGHGVRQAARSRTHFSPVIPAVSAILLGILIGSAGMGVAQQGAKGLDHIRVITLPDTRGIATHWVARHLPIGARIVREPHTPNVGKVRHPDNPGAKFRVQALRWSVTDLTPSQIKQFDYVVVSSQMYQRFVRDPSAYPQQAARYKELFGLHLVHAFKGDGVTRSGPEIRIYEIPHPPRIPADPVP